MAVISSSSTVKTATRLKMKTIRERIPEWVPVILATILDVALVLLFILGIMLAHVSNSDHEELIESHKIQPDLVNHVFLCLSFTGVLFLYSGIREFRTIRKMKLGFENCIHYAKFMSMILVSAYLITAPFFFIFYGEDKFNTEVLTSNPFKLMKFPYILFTLMYYCVALSVAHYFHGPSQKKENDLENPLETNLINPLNEQHKNLDPSCSLPPQLSGLSVVDLPEILTRPEVIAALGPHARRTPLNLLSLSIPLVPETPLDVAGMSRGSKSVLDCKNEEDQLPSTATLNQCDTSKDLENVACSQQMETQIELKDIVDLAAPINSFPHEMDDEFAEVFGLEDLENAK